MKSVAVFSVAAAILLSGFAHAAAIPPVSSNQFITIDGKEVSLEPPTDSTGIEARGDHHGYHFSPWQKLAINNRPVVHNGTVVERAELPASSKDFITIDGEEVSLEPPTKRAEAPTSSNEYIIIDGKEVSLEPPTKRAEAPATSNDFITIAGKEVSLEPPTTDTSDLASSHASSHLLEKRCLPFCAPALPLIPFLGFLPWDKAKLRTQGPVREYTIDAKGRLCIESHRPAVGTCFAQRYKGYHHYCPDAARRWASAPVNAAGPTQVIEGEMHNGVWTTSTSQPGISGSFKKGSYKDGVPGHPIDAATAPKSGFISGARIPGKPGFVGEFSGNGVAFDNDGNSTWSDAAKPVNGTSSKNETVTIGDQEVQFQNGAASWAATGKPLDGTAIEGGIIKVGGRVVSYDDLMSASSAKDDVPKFDSGKTDPAPKDATADLPIGNEISKSAKGGVMKLNGLPSAELLADPDSKSAGVVDNESELPKADGKTDRKLIPGRAAGSSQQD
nr:hypothetical protein B0A51_00157 [Rachicladosporium sp. CCFEE 5018]